MSNKLSQECHDFLISQGFDYTKQAIPGWGVITINEYYQKGTFRMYVDRDCVGTLDNIKETLINAGIEIKEYPDVKAKNKEGTGGYLTGSSSAINPDHYNGTACLDVIQSMCKHLPGDEASIMSHIVKYEFRYPNKGLTPAEQLKDLLKGYEYYGYLIKLFKEKHNV